MTLRTDQPGPLSSGAQVSTVTASIASPKVAAPSLWRDYLTLTKPEISFLVTLSTLAGFLFGARESIDALRLIYTLAGVVLTAAGSGALNHYIERDIDTLMRRTARRPLSTGRVSPVAARAFGILLIGAGLAILCPLANPLTGVLATLTSVLYLFVYTPLKRKTKYNTLIGTIPGALPALGGFTAATGTFGAGGWAIFAILACWQMPHFFSLAWMYRKDYARAGYAMLPVVEADGKSTVRQTVLFTGLTIVASIVPTILGITGWFYFFGALVLGLWFMRPVYRFYYFRTVQDTRRVLMASVFYIPLLVGLIVVDWFL